MKSGWAAGVLISTEFIGLLVVLAILASGTLYAFKGSAISEQVVLDQECMSRCRHLFWHRHAYTGPSRSDVAGGRRRVRTPGRQHVAAGNRHYAGRGLDHSSFKSRGSASSLRMHAAGIMQG